MSTYFIHRTLHILLVPFSNANNGQCRVCKFFNAMTPSNHFFLHSHKAQIVKKKIEPKWLCGVTEWQKWKWVCDDLQQSLPFVMAFRFLGGCINKTNVVCILSFCASNSILKRVLNLYNAQKYIHDSQCDWMQSIA